MSHVIEGIIVVVTLLLLFLPDRNRKAQEQDNDAETASTDSDGGAVAKAMLLTVASVFGALIFLMFATPFHILGVLLVIVGVPILTLVSRMRRKQDDETVTHVRGRSQVTVINVGHEDLITLRRQQRAEPQDNSQTNAEQEHE